VPQYRQLRSDEHSEKPILPKTLSQVAYETNGGNDAGEAVI
jgi:hypothetical protein